MIDPTKSFRSTPELPSPEARLPGARRSGFVQLALIALFALLLITTASCRTSDGSEPDASEPVDVASTEAPDLSSIQTLENGWASLAPGADTVCSDGSDYRFFVRPGETSKLMVYLQGGGGCWDGATCSSDRFGSFKATVADDDPSQGSGIFAADNPANPFSDYSIVYIPYCTGDVHLGDTEQTYGVAALEDPSEAKEGANPDAHEVTIRHRGHHNAMTVLSWVFDNFDGPETVFVTGSSAGSIPSPYYAAHLKQQYPDSRVVQLGDGSGGYRRSANGWKPYQSWGALDAIDVLDEFQSLSDDDFNYEQLYISAAKAHPDVMFASYDTAEDQTQLQFLALGGEPTESLQPLLDANLDQISASVSNFVSFVAGGDVHVILPRPEFYTYAVDGVSFRDWIAALAAGEKVESMHCHDSCAAPELVAGAAAATGP